MSRVDFYIVTDGTSIVRFACHIVVKVWGQGKPVHIHTESEEMAGKIDDLLWTFRDISFVPHEIFDGGSTKETPVTIGIGDCFPEGSQIMINLDNEIPEFADRFEQIVEIVGGDDVSKQYARQRYRQYKENHYDIYDHKSATLNNDV